MESAAGAGRAIHPPPWRSSALALPRGVIVSSTRAEGDREAPDAAASGRPRQDTPLRTIAPAILNHYPDLSEAQREIVGYLDGPLLVIAGPGSGKTYSIVLRALNLLLLEKARPNELVLCTFTEKAAFELRDRLAAAARKVRYTGDLSELTASTIHGFCNRVLTQHRHRTELGHNFDTLNELTQLLFIFEHFDEIVGPPENNLFLLRWKTRWTAIEGARGYFDKITEELIEYEQLAGATDPFLRAIGTAYGRYERALRDSNRTDFAHLQRLVLQLIDNAGTAAMTLSGTRAGPLPSMIRPNTPAVHLAACHCSSIATKA